MLLIIPYIDSQKDLGCCAKIVALCPSALVPQMTTNKKNPKTVTAAMYRHYTGDELYSAGNNCQF